MWLGLRLSLSLVVSVCFAWVAASTGDGREGLATDPYGWIKAIEAGPGRIHKLEARVYEIDRQYILPPGTRLVGAGSGGGLNSTTIVAKQTKPAQKGSKILV